MYASKWGHSSRFESYFPFIQPSNFLFKQDGTLKIADFGTAYAQENFFDPEVAK